MGALGVLIQWESRPEEAPPRVEAGQKKVELLELGQGSRHADQLRLYHEGLRWTGSCIESTAWDCIRHGWYRKVFPWMTNQISPLSLVSILIF